MVSGTRDNTTLVTLGVLRLFTATLKLQPAVYIMIANSSRDDTTRVGELSRLEGGP